MLDILQYNTEEKYKQSEKDAATLNIVFSIVGFATLGIGKGGQIGGKAIMIYIGGEMTANVTIKATTEFMDEMGAPKWLQDITGLAAGVFVSNKIQGYMKTGVRTLDDITDMGLKNIDDIKKFGIGNIDDLKNIGIRDIDDLLKAGVRNPEDLLKLGVKNLDDLAELGISSLDDLSRIGIKNADDLSRLGIKNADEVFNGLKGASGAKNSVDDIINGVEKGDIKLTNNMQKVNYGEMKMDSYYKQQGYERVSLDRVLGLDDVTHQGIDGVYYKPDGHPPYVISEAKYGSSKLGMTNDGKQMSSNWIDNRLDNAV